MNIKNAYLNSINKSIPILPNMSFKGNDYFCSAQFLLKDEVMVPNKDYIIDENTVFEVCGHKIDLAKDELKKRVSSLRKNENFIIGRTTNIPQNLPDTVSRMHLSICRDRDGNLTARDLKSYNGTTIKANIQEIQPEQGKQPLIAGKYYLVPSNAVVALGPEEIHFSDYTSRLKSLTQDEKLIIGRGPDSDIVIKNNYLSNQHLEIRPFMGKILVKDLHSTNGSSYQYCDNQGNQKPFIYRPGFDIQPFKHPDNDYRFIKTTEELKKQLPTKIPKDCQISIGENFCIDMRNKNILNLLEEKGRIKLGRNYSSDVIIDGFYNDASREHLILEKVGNDILATDISSTSTKIIPKNQIKAFNNGVGELVFGQHNIGDCYLLANLYALSVTPKGQEYIKNMVTVDNAGNYIVDLYGAYGPISIEPEALDGQKIGSSEKMCVSGDLGLRAIERAYGRMLRLPRNENRTLFADIDEGGIPTNALKKLIGLSGSSFDVKLTNINEILNGICTNGFEKYVLTCSTPNVKSGDYVDIKGRFPKKHAYGIKSIDAKKKTIEIVNPHNTKKSTNITWREFSKYFDFLNIAKFENQ